MKKLLFAALAVLSMNAFAQSYVVISNGVVLTTDKAGFVYDFGVFIMPYQVQINGGSFLVENEKLATIDEKGFLYNKDLKIKKYKGKGLNYLIDDDSDIITVAANGNYFKYKDENLKKANKFGGNFFIVTKDAKKFQADLYTLNQKGNYFKMNIPGLNASNITMLGGTYFVANNFLHSVDKDGMVYPKTSLLIPGIKKLGGNFFIDGNNKLWTVAENGVVSTPVLPIELNTTIIQKIGSNYMIDLEGKMFVVDAAGNVALRPMQLHDMRNAKVLSR